MGRRMEGDCHGPETAMVQRLAWWGGQQCRELMAQRREES